MRIAGWKCREGQLDREHDKELADLLVRGQQGDREAYELFLFGASKVLRSYVRARGRRDAEEDVLQESLLAIHLARHSYLSGRPVGPWIFAICEHRLIDFVRREKRRVKTEESLAREGKESGPTPSGGATPAGRIWDALAALPIKQRAIIEMLKVQGLSIKEVAVQTNMSEGSVKVTAFRGYEAIRKMLGGGKK